MICIIIKRKSRYVLVEASEGLDIESAYGEISKDLLSFLGERTYSYANPKLAVQYNNSVFGIRVNRDYERQVILALSFIKELDGKRIGLYTLKTSGTLRSLADYVKGHIIRDKDYYT